MRKIAVILCCLIVGIIAMLGISMTKHLMAKGNVEWIGTPALVGQNSLFTKEPAIEFGLRADGIVIWREVKP